MLTNEIFDRQGAVVRKAEFPEREFDIRLLDVVRIKAHGDEQDVFASGSSLLKKENVVVPCVEK